MDLFRIIVFTFIVHGTAFAQTGFIKGIIDDTLDFSDIKGTAYLTTNEPIFFEVDSTGKFFLDSLQPGQWDVVLEKPGYEPLMMTGVIVRAYKHTILDDLHLFPIGLKKKKSKRKR